LKLNVFVILLKPLRMKSKDLIALLQKYDPTGETEVTIGNSTHILVQPMPAYYDGSVQEFVFDPPRKEYDYIWNNLKAIKIKRSGQKIDLQSLNISDYYWDFHDLNPQLVLPIDFSDQAECCREQYENLKKQIDAEAAEIFKKDDKTRDN
jgi:hypothetical protein